MGKIFFNNILNIPKTSNYVKNQNFRSNMQMPSEDVFVKNVQCVDIFQENVFNAPENSYLPEYVYHNPLGICVAKPHYIILDLYVKEKYKGSGTQAIKRVVKKSLTDNRTQGRVALAAQSLDNGVTCPSGFYYKLGFRFTNDKINEVFEEWLKNGGKRESAPHIEGSMFLPQKNIQHCLCYK